ncbi:MAG TPA: ABC transporter ATP-binding protein [Candidatus Paceibacterota bacterium]|jgi:ABC-type multidrug transport system, ATPase and permease components
MKHDTPTERAYTFKDFRNGLGMMYRTTEGYRSRLAVLLLIVVGMGIANGLFPIAFGHVVDAVASEAGQKETLKAMIVLAAVLFGTRFLSNVQGRIQNFVDESMRLSYMHGLFSKMLRLPVSFHKTHRHGEVTEKINRGVQAIPQFWSEYVFSLLPQFVFIAIASVYVFQKEQTIGWILVGAALLYSVISILFVQPFARLQRKVQNAYTKARGVAGDALFNVRMVKEAASESNESAKMHKAWFEDSLGPRLKMLSAQRNLALFQGIIENSARIAALWMAYLAIRNGLMTIGAFAALATYVSSFFEPLRQLFRQWRFIQNSLISMEDADKLAHEQEEPYRGKELPQTMGQIVFDRTSFSYDGQTPILKDVSFEAKAGEVVAFVGESGVGKSSLIDLVSAYYLPDSGSVSIDGIDTREIDLGSLRRAVAVVSQEITLFNSSIQENIRYGIPDVSDEKVRWAAEKAKCDFIERLPNKWDQQVGERGMKLSVGQKQRIAIARAFLRDPKILVLDEPTSALDAASEAHIVQSLDEIMKDRTTLIIAHRLSTVRKADKILVFKEGKIVEQGTYQELVEKGGEFKRLRDLQTLNE